MPFFFVFGYMCVYTGLQVCTHAFGGPKLMLGVLLDLSPPSLLRQGLWLNPELPDLASLSSLASKIPCLCLLYTAWLLCWVCLHAGIWTLVLTLAGQPLYSTSHLPSPQDTILTSGSRELWGTVSFRVILYAPWWLGTVHSRLWAQYIPATLVNSDVLMTRRGLFTKISQTSTASIGETDAQMRQGHCVFRAASVRSSSVRAWLESTTAGDRQVLQLHWQFT